MPDPNTLATEATLVVHEVILRRWRWLTGDPPLKKITAQVLAKFRDALSASPGMTRDKEASPNTVRSKMVFIQAVLDRYYFPYHEKLSCGGSIKDIRLGIDCHTMAATGPPIGWLHERPCTGDPDCIGLLPIGHTLIQATNNSVNLGQKISVYTGTSGGCPTNPKRC